MGGDGHAGRKRGGTRIDRAACMQHGRGQVAAKPRLHRRGGRQRAREAAAQHPWKPCRPPPPHCLTALMLPLLPWLVNDSVQAAVAYNDQSINENMHAAAGFKLLAKKENNFLCRCAGRAA